MMIREVRMATLRSMVVGKHQMLFLKQRVNSIMNLS